MNYDIFYKHSSKHQYYVYVYLDPSVQGSYYSITSTMLFLPFYVGKGKGNRYRLHLSKKPYRHPFSAKIAKIRELHNQDPHTVILASFDDENEAYAFEVDLILKYTQQNIHLTNLEPGGRIHGPGRTPNTLKGSRVSSLKGIPRSEAVRQKISSSKKLHHPTAKHWLAISPCGVEYRTKSLRQTITTLGFSDNNYKTLINVHLKGSHTVQAGRMKGWQIFSLV